MYFEYMGDKWLGLHEFFRFAGTIKILPSIFGINSQSSQNNPNLTPCLPQNYMRGVRWHNFVMGF